MSEVVPVQVPARIRRAAAPTVPWQIVCRNRYRPCTTSESRPGPKFRYSPQRVSETVVLATLLEVRPTCGQSDSSSAATTFTLEPAND